MRYAYVKANDVVEELRRVGRPPSNLPQGGPDAYVAHFLHVIGDQDALLLSTQAQKPQGQSLREGNLVAYSFYWHSRLFRRFGKLARSPFATFWTRTSISLKIYFYLIRFRPDAILCWSTSFPLWATFLAAQVRSVPFIYSRHNRIVRKNEPWFRRLTGAVDRSIMRRAVAVIAHGAFLKDQLVEVGVSPSKLIEFNWSYEDFSNTTQNSDATLKSELGTKSVILFVGRVTALKGVFQLLEACEEMLRRDSALQLKFAGAGPDFDRLCERIDELGLNDRVELLGMVPHDRLGSVIRRSKVVVTPTLSKFPEGRCMAAMEGLVMGRPVIAPDFGPFPYLVKHKMNGLLYTPDSPEDLGRKISQILEDETLYERLCKGAERSGRELKQASTSFSDALRRALVLSEDCGHCLENQQ